jgi:hypothetical protein
MRARTRLAVFLHYNRVASGSARQNLPGGRVMREPVLSRVQPAGLGRI